MDSNTSQTLSDKRAYWSKDRERLLEWFRKNAPSLGELYEGAVQILFEKLPGRTRFVAFAVREIRNRLPDVLNGIVGGQPLQYVNRLDDILKEWKKSGFPTNGSLPIEVSDEYSLLSGERPKVSLPIKLYRKISKLVRDHAKTRQKPEEKALMLFKALVPENQDQLHPIIRHWVETTEWFVKRVHDSGRVDEDFDINEYIKKFELFEWILCSLIRPFFENLEAIDEILEEANS